jgi:hypothetical protein
VCSCGALRRPRATSFSSLRVRSEAPSQASHPSHPIRGVRLRRDGLHRWGPSQLRRNATRNATSDGHGSGPPHQIVVQADEIAGL